MLWRYRKLVKYSFLTSVILLMIYKRCPYKRVGSSTLDNYNLSEEEISKLLSKAEAENFARLSHLKQICQSYQLGKSRPSSSFSSSLYREPLPHYEIFYYSVKNKLSWCPTYKAASTTWLYHFASLGGATEEQIKESKLQISTFVRKLYQPLNVIEAIKFLPTSLKFLIVRHPFERILSAYRDKLETITSRTDSGTYFYYKKYGRRIVEKYRKGGNNTHTKSILQNGQYLWDEQVRPAGVEPTFKEFVRYLIDTNLILRADDHWIPFYVYCTPCTIDYEIIGKVETMLNDQLLVIYKSGMQNQLKPHWRHKTNLLDESNYNKMSKVAKIYFSQLNAADVEELYDKYKLDFELFQYNASEYLDYVSKLASR